MKQKCYNHSTSMFCPYKYLVQLPTFDMKTAARDVKHGHFSVTVSSRAIIRVSIRNTIPKFP
jgi:hypothetical protein